MGFTLVPYLTFNGDAKQAMKFYHSMLGGKLTMQTFGESKMGKTPAEKDLIIHATLQNKALIFMASDSMPSRKARFGDNMYMGISGSDRRKLSGVFNRLADGGKIGMPLEKTFWADACGMVTDRFGTPWMVNGGVVA